MSAPICHVCVVSERLLASLIPALAERPALAVLAASAEMQRLGLDQRLERLLEERGVAVEVYDGLPDTGLAAIAEFARALRDEVRERHPDHALVLNITGGNKLMTLAFFDAFRGAAERIVYTDTEHRSLETLRPGADGAERVPLPGVLDVPTYLAAQGFLYEGARSDASDWQRLARERAALTQALAGRAHDLGALLRELNYLAREALDEHGEELLAPSQILRRAPPFPWAALLRQAAALGILGWDGAREVSFRDADAARYLGGAWLEEFAWLAASQLRPADARCGVNGRWESAEEARNELDLVLVHANRLLLVECKTLRLGVNEARDQEILYKLDSLGEDVRSLFGQTLLLSARALTRPVLERAAHQRITVIGPADLPTFPERLRRWMAGD